ncbi:phage tail tape measure protein [Hymenobacter aerilatus]|uniref:Phage tail tape measure protein n=1 Tax=Hymenobacter aerilatus TaxID=2932251 RepID=A0A8T9T5N9_9BACT|nr:phage tail tape measure protein [Hymenobacter aerilatus]UOR07159.1 phage tail tape measure protein [Hymenobacter aerilatus]
MDLGALNVAIGADLSGLESGLNVAATRVQSFASTANKAATDAAGSLSGVGTAAATIGSRVAGGLNEADKAMGRYIDAQGKMRDANGRWVSSSTLAAEAAKNVGGAAATAGNGFKGLAAGAGNAADTINGKLIAAFKAGDAAAKGLKDGVGRLGDGLKDVGQAASIGISAPITLAFGLAGKAAVDFESAFAGVKKTLDTTGLSAAQTESEYARLSAGIRQLATEIPAAATEIAKVAEAAGQLGIKRENVLDFTKTMIDLGNSTNLSSDQAATALARLANITQLPQTQFSNLGSAVVALGNNFATTESEIVEIAGRLAGAGKQINLTEADILAFGTALSSLGINAEAGGTALSTVFKRIQLAVENGGSDLNKFAKVAGVSADAFAKSFRTNAAGAIVDFTEGLGRIKDQGGSTLKTLADLELNDIRVSDSLLRLAGSGDVARRAIELSGKAFSDNTALAKEAGQRYETTASQIQIAKNRLTELGITVGNQLLPLLKGFSATVGAITGALNNMSPAAAKTVLVVGGLVAAIGPLAFGLGSIISLLAPGGALIVGLEALGAAVTVATGPIGLAVAAVAALAAGLVYLSNSSERTLRSYQDQKTATQELTTSVEPLLARYEELQSKTALTAGEQAELETIIQKVTTAIPSARGEIDAYGKTLSLNTKRTREFIAAQQQLTVSSARQSIESETEELQKREKVLRTLRERQEIYNRTGKVFVTSGGRAFYSDQTDDIVTFQKELVNATKAFDEQKNVVTDLRRTLGDFSSAGVQISSVINPAIGGLTKGFLGLGAAATTGLNAVKGAADKTGKALVTLKELEEQLKAALEQRYNDKLAGKDLTADDALIKRLRAQIAEFKQLPNTAKKALSEVERAFKQLRDNLRGLDGQVKLGIVSEGVEETTKRIAILETGLSRLAKVGVTSANRAFASFTQQLVTLRQSLDTGFDQLDGGKIFEGLRMPRTVKDTLDRDIQNILGDYKSQPLDLPVRLNFASMRGGGEGLALTNETITLNKALAEAAQGSVDFGATFDYTGAKIAAVSASLANLRAQGIDPTTVGFVESADGTGVYLRNISEVGEGVESLTDKFKRLTEQQALVETFKFGVASALSGIADSIGEAFGAIVTGSATIGDGLQFVFGSIISAIGDFMKTFGQQLIAIGIAKLALDNLFKSGAAGGIAAIAAGIGLVALGGVVSAVGKQAAGQLGSITGAGSAGTGPAAVAAPKPADFPKSQALKVEVDLKSSDDASSVLTKLLRVDQYRTLRKA